MIRVDIHGKNLHLETITRLVGRAVDSRYPTASVSVRRINPPTTRAQRCAEAVGQAQDAGNTFQELLDELQSWYEALPDAFRDGELGDALSEAISSLEEAVAGIEQAVEAAESVTFPGMYGR